MTCQGTVAVFRRRNPIKLEPMPALSAPPVTLKGLLCIELGREGRGDALCWGVREYLRCRWSMAVPASSAQEERRSVHAVGLVGYLISRRGLPSGCVLTTGASLRLNSTCSNHRLATAWTAVEAVNRYQTCSA
jgi:hypothetical protein